LGHGSNDDGALETNQIAELDLRKTGLVVLSGCRSQAGRLTRGDEIIGLSRAFIYAGSPSVIASLWSVDDEATRALMVSFYSHLRQGLSQADALRSAQIDVRKDFPHPYYWAGFVLTGDPGSPSSPNTVTSATR
jgi:CHAT domain-containing protein